MQKLVLQIMKMKKMHLIKIRTLNIFQFNKIEERKKLEEFDEFDETDELARNSKFVQWNQTGKHATQLIRILHTISKITDECNDQNIEKSKILKNLWSETNDYINL